MAGVMIKAASRMRRTWMVMGTWTYSPHWAVPAPSSTQRSRGMRTVSLVTRTTMARLHSKILPLASNFGRTDAAWEDGDFDGDGAVNFSDFVILANNFGQFRPLPEPANLAEEPAGISAPRNLNALAADVLFEQFDDEQNLARIANPSVKYRCETEKADCGWTARFVMFGRAVAICVSFRDGRIGNPSYEEVCRRIYYRESLTTRRSL